MAAAARRIVLQRLAGGAAAASSLGVFYRTLPALEAAGLVRRFAPGRAGARTMVEITPAGRRWLAAQPRPAPPKEQPDA